MTKVYIVTSGTYSDYTIDRVFLDKEKAEAYIKLCDHYHWDMPIIEEHEADDDKPINEIVYVDGYYRKNSSENEVDVSIKRSNSLDSDEQEIKYTRFNKSYPRDYSLSIQRVIHGNFDEAKIIEKYKKVLYDLMAHIEYLLSTGWSQKMIQEWLEEKSDGYINEQ